MDCHIALFECYRYCTNTYILPVQSLTMEIITGQSITDQHPHTSIGITNNAQALNRNNQTNITLVSRSFYKKNLTVDTYGGVYYKFQVKGTLFLGVHQQIHRMTPPEASVRLCSMHCKWLNLTMTLLNTVHPKEVEFLKWK